MGANATTFVPTYVAGQVLEAADLNVTNSGVPVFADATARDAAFGGSGEKVLAEGQLAYLEDLNIVQYYDSTSWLTLAPKDSAVLQVKSTTKTDTFSTSSTSFTDITGLTVSITPSSASNKVLVMAMVSWSVNVAAQRSFIQLVRDSTAICLGDAASSRTQATLNSSNNTADDVIASPIVFLDSPNTTSATTYKLQILVNTGSVYVNRSFQDTNNNAYSRVPSTITVFEVLP